MTCRWLRRWLRTKKLLQFLSLPECLAGAVLSLLLPVLLSPEALPPSVSFRQGQMRPVLIMAENRDPLRFTKMCFFVRSFSVCGRREKVEKEKRMRPCFGKKWGKRRRKTDRISRQSFILHWCWTFSSIKTLCFEPTYKYWPHLAPYFALRLYCI